MRSAGGAGGRRYGRDRRRPADAGPIAWAGSGLALVPSALLTAFTTHVTTDVASAPLLWVLPLALYLLTFVLVFRDKPLIPREALLFLHLVAVAFALLDAVADQARDLVPDGVDRCRRVLHLRHGGAPHAVRGPSGGPLPYRVLPVDVVRRRARRPVRGADRAQASSARCSSIRCCWRCPWRAGRACSTSPLLRGRNERSKDGCAVGLRASIDRQECGVLAIAAPARRSLMPCAIPACASTWARRRSSWSCWPLC